MQAILRECIVRGCSKWPIGLTLMHCMARRGCPPSSSPHPLILLSFSKAGGKKPLKKRFIPFPGGTAMRVAEDVYISPLYGRIHDLFYQCPCEVTRADGVFLADFVRVKDLPLILYRAQSSPFCIHQGVMRSRDYCVLVLFIKRTSYLY